MKNKQIIVVGLGRFGMALAETLVENGCEVMAIDTNEERLDEIAPRITQGNNGIKCFGIFRT